MTAPEPAGRVADGAGRKLRQLADLPITTLHKVGPAVAGVLISLVGIGWAFALNALSFVAVIAALLLMRTRELLRTPLAPRGPGQSDLDRLLRASHP